MDYLTSAEMKTEFLVGYDRVASLAAPGYDNDEISLFLNRAQDRLVKTRYNYKGNKYKEGIEQTEKRRKDFSELFRGPYDTTGTLLASVSSNQFGVHKNGTFYDLPSDFLLSLSEEAKTSIICSDGSNKMVEVFPVTQDQYTANINNPHKRPSKEKIWRMDFSKVTVGPSGAKRHELITDGSYTISEYHLRYLKRPRQIDIDGNVDCELDGIVHRDIVDIAVEIALENIQDPRWQSKKADNFEIE